MVWWSPGLLGMPCRWRVGRSDHIWERAAAETGPLGAVVNRSYSLAVATYDVDVCDQKGAGWGQCRSPTGRFG